MRGLLRNKLKLVRAQIKVALLQIGKLADQDSDLDSDLESTTKLTAS